MTLILNVLWFVFGGWLSGLMWLLAALLLACTVIGLPWALAAARIGVFSFAPFGRDVLPRDLVTGRPDLGTGPLGLLLNILWFLLGGWYVALAHLVIGLGLLVTIIGIPFALQHFKLAVLALAPIGKTVVDR